MSQSGFAFPQPLSERYAKRKLRNAELHVLRDISLWYQDARAWADSQELLRRSRYSFVRTRSVNMLSLVAVPAEQPKISGKPEGNDSRIPPAASDSILPVMTSRIVAPISLSVVNGQELLHNLATADTAVTVVGKDDSLASDRLLTLPVEHVGAASAVRGVSVGSGLDLASVTQALSAQDAALSTDTSFAAFLEPSSFLDLLLFGKHDRV